MEFSKHEKKFRDNSFNEEKYNCKEDLELRGNMIQNVIK